VPSPPADLACCSRQAEFAIGRKKLDQDYTMQHGLWFCSSRLAKEGPVDSTDVDGAPFFDAISFRKVVPIVLVHPSSRPTSPTSMTVSSTTLAWNLP